MSFRDREEPDPYDSKQEWEDFKQKAKIAFGAVALVAIVGVAAISSSGAEDPADKPEKEYFLPKPPQPK